MGNNYQEQVMQTLRFYLDLPQEADILRRAMGKKKRAELKNKKKFVREPIKMG